MSANQTLYKGLNSITKLDSILQQEKPSHVFLITGKNSFTTSGAQQAIEEALHGYEYTRFSDFEVNPKLNDVKRGVSLYTQSHADLVIAVGGGSVIDVAKSINAFASNEQDPQKYLSGTPLEHPTNPFVAIPTTAGTGSEATQFAVVYIDGKKHSLDHEFLLPKYVILDGALTTQLSPYITACTGMDALSQAIESYWAVKSTEESRTYAQQAIPTLLKLLPSVIQENASADDRQAVLEASYHAGQAINISRTTAAHAVSYPITSKFDVPHGQAVALTLPAFIEFNGSLDPIETNGDLTQGQLRTRMNELYTLLGTTTASDSARFLREFISSLGLQTSLRELDIGTNENKQYIIANGFNPARVTNNPRIVTKQDLEHMLV